jgi:AcrR family transcriptional regulator
MKMKRAYTLKKRAESQAETKQRIVEAAVDLHTEIGPARTTFSMVAERAGVQRHTLYAHFPDERALLMACSGYDLERHPLPDAGPWKKIEDRDERLLTALTEIYESNARNEQLIASVLRDAEVTPLVQDIVKIRWAPHFKTYHDVLDEKRTQKQRAMIALALSFYTWRTLVRDGKLSTRAAAQTMTQAIIDAK